MPFHQGLEVIRKVYKYFEEITGSALLVAICLIAALQVAGRYLFERPFSFTEELSAFLFVYLSFIGASLALKKNEHFALEIFPDRIPKRLRRIMGFISALLVLFCSVVIFLYGCHLTVSGLHVITPTLEIPYSYAYAAVPLGGFLMLVRSVEMLIKRISSPGDNPEAEKKQAE